MVNWFTFLKHIPRIGVNFLLDEGKGFYFLSLVDVESTKFIFLLTRLKSSWCTMILHTWIQSFNFHSWKIEVACVNIFTNVAFGVHDYQIIIIRQIGTMFKFEYTNKMQWDLRFCIVVDSKDEWNIEFHMFNLKGGWLKCA
jgi:hypothetical protein